MPEPFDAYQYIDHLRGRWKLVAIACGVAVTLALVAGLLLTSQYTATARIVIDPPAGGDVRASVAVSPIYLESLRTYEHFAASDSLFHRALDRFWLRRQDPRRPVESWKRGLLKVGIPRNTKILEIAVKLPDPKKAQAVALYLAEETVKLNRAMSREADSELSTDVEKRLEEARLRRDQAEADWRRLAVAEPVEGLAAEIETMETHRLRLERELQEAEVWLAEAAEQAKAAPLELQARVTLRSAQVRVDSIRAQLKPVQQDLLTRRTLLGARSARREQTEGERRSAQAAYETMLTRVQDVRAAAGYRGERLRIIDPGIVPERPSFPNTPLHVVAALLFALLASLGYLSFDFSVRRERATPRQFPLRVAGKGGDD